MRQVGWLHAAPEKSNPHDKTEPVSRIEAMQRRGETPLLPPNPAPYLTDWLMEIGPVTYSAMGSSPIGWPDLAAWQDLTGIELEPWEARLLRRLSGCYAAETQAAKKRDRAAPYTGTAPEIVNGRDLVARKVRALFGLRKKQS